MYVADIRTNTFIIIGEYLLTKYSLLKDHTFRILGTIKNDQPFLEALIHSTDIQAFSQVGSLEIVESLFMCAEKPSSCEAIKISWLPKPRECYIGISSGEIARSFTAYAIDELEVFEDIDYDEVLVIGSVVQRGLQLQRFVEPIPISWKVYGYSSGFTRSTPLYQITTYAASVRRSELNIALPKKDCYYLAQAEILHALPYRPNLLIIQSDIDETTDLLSIPGMVPPLGSGVLHGVRWYAELCSRFLEGAVDHALELLNITAYDR